MSLKGRYVESLGCFLNKGVILFYPYVNIDGYQAYIKADRQHQGRMRKNMNGNESQCRSGTAGVDINRNFPSSYGTVR
jgi:hypothetical protein